MFHFRLRTRGVSPSQRQRSWGRPELERLEDRVVPSIVDGTIIVPTTPSLFVSPPPSGFPKGIIGVNPNNGTQTPISTGGVFNTPQCVVEAPNRIGLLPATPQLYVVDTYAGTNGLGAIIEYDPLRGTTQIVATGGKINGPVSAAFHGAYLYVANCTDKTLVRLDPTNGWRQDYVTVNGMTSGFFTVVTGLIPVPGNPNSLYLLDEGGFVSDPGQGQVWELNFTNSLTASEVAFGSKFPNDPNAQFGDYRHPGAFTRDLSNPSSVDPIVGAGAQGGGNPTLVIVHPTSFEILAQANYLSWGNGLTMGQGPYGNYTIFLSNIANGGPSPPNPPPIPAQITAINRFDAQHQENALTVGGNLSSPGGMVIYFNSGGRAAAPRVPHSPFLAGSEAQANNAGLTPQQTLLSGATTTTVPSAPPVVLPSQRIPPMVAGELTFWSARPAATHQVSVKKTAVDSFFADWVSALVD